MFKNKVLKIPKTQLIKLKDLLLSRIQCRLLWFRRILDLWYMSIYILAYQVYFLVQNTPLCKDEKMSIHMRIYQHTSSHYRYLFHRGHKPCQNCKSENKLSSRLCLSQQPSYLYPTRQPSRFHLCHFCCTGPSKSQINLQDNLRVYYRNSFSKHCGQSPCNRHRASKYLTLNHYLRFFFLDTRCLRHHYLLHSKMVHH